MIAFNNERNEPTWQSDFVAMLPEIQQKLRLAFFVDWIRKLARMLSRRTVRDAL
jgi:hypothetical protein